MTDNDGWTALHYYARYGDYEKIIYFENKGINMKIETNDGKNCLHIAALYGHLNLCKRLIDEHNFNALMTDYDGWTPLHFSAKFGSCELVTYFADMGIDIRTRTNEGKNCLHVAANMGHFELCKELIHKYNFNVHEADTDGWTALHYSAQTGSYELVTYFADLGADIQLNTYDGKNCLHIATLHGHLNLCKTLIDKHNFDVNIADDNGWTVLHYSVRKGSYELFSIFTVTNKETNIYAKNKIGMNCLHLAALHGHLNICKTLIDKYKFDMHISDNDGWTAFHYFAGNGSEELVTYLLDLDSASDLKDKDGWNFLHIAALCGHLNLCKTLIDQKNFDVHLADNSGCTALHFSARNGSYELVQFFVERGVNIDLKDKDGCNCLHIGALYGHLNFCKTLMHKHNLDVGLVDDDGWTPHHFSARNGSYELLKYFVNMGGCIYSKGNNEENCLHIAALYGHLGLCKKLKDEYMFDVDMADIDGWRPLHFSARNGSYGLVKYFADTVTDINLKTKDGKNCLHIAALYGHLNLCKALKNKHNFDVNLADNNGWTALHFSARSGNYEFLRYFIDMGTDIKLETADGRNCFHIAAHEGHFHLSKILVNEHKFDVHVSDKNGWTAIHFSAANGSYEFVKFFADIKSDIHLKTNDGKNCLHIAACYGHLNLGQKLIDEHEFDVHLADNNGWTPLHFAAKNGSYELIKYFADMETDIHLKTFDGKDCLHIAASNRYLNLCKKLILGHNFDINLVDKSGWSALHFSARSGSFNLFTYFADMLTDVNIKENNEGNCLHIAALYGHFNLSRTLINEYNFDAHTPDKNGWTALHFSAKNGSYELVGYFVKMNTDIQLKTNDGKNCLHIAACNGHLNLCKILIHEHSFDVNMIDYDGWNALHYCSQNGNYQLITFFVNMGIDINSRTIDEKSCLHIAALFGHLKLCKTLKNKHNFDVNLADKNGWTALHFSARNGNYELVTYFVHMGTNIFVKTNDGKNCLHIAALFGHLKLCENLTNNHIFDENSADNNGWTALHFSAKNGNDGLFAHFYKMGIDIDLKNKDGWDCRRIAVIHGHLNLCRTLIDKGNFDVHRADKDGWTALHFSARNGVIELFTYFINMGSDINLKTNDGKNCLHIAALHGHLNLCRKLKYEYKYDVHITDNNGWTALHFSARNGSYELVTFFTEMKTDIQLKTVDGKNCLHIAAWNGHLNLCKTLIDKHSFDVNAANNDGWTAFLFCARSGSHNLFRYFADTVTDIDFKANNEMNCLHIATLYGHLNLCKTLISRNRFDVHMTDNANWTALHFSARNGSYELVRFFACMGIDINLKTKNGQNCLHIAALFGHFDLCQTLMAEHNFKLDATDNFGWRPIHFSARNGSYKLFKYFVDMETNIQQETNDGKNCLHIAALYGHLNLCKTLIDKYGFDVFIADNYGWTTLHFSAKSGNEKLFMYFANMGIDIDCTNNDGLNCRHISAIYGHYNLCKKLIEKRNFDVHMADNDGWTALHFSAKNGSYEVITFFVDMGIDINLKTNDGKNCLHIAALYGHMTLCKILKDKHNFDIHIPNNDGWTAIHFSAKNGSYNLVKYFIDMGFNVHLKINDGKDCLHIAALSGHLNLCKTLIEKHNFDVYMADTCGCTALHLSARYGSSNLFSYFVDKRIDIHKKDRDSCNSLHIAALYGNLKLCRVLVEKYHFDVDMDDTNGWTALHFSAKSGSYELVTYFLNMGIDIDLKTNDGKNCLHIAVCNKHFNLCKYFLSNVDTDRYCTDKNELAALHYCVKTGSRELLKLFADMGQDLNFKAYNGMNCLHIAALYGHLNLCKALIDNHNFDVNMSDNDGWTALHFSARNGSYNLVEFFTVYGIDINLQTNDGRNCFHIAALFGNLNLFNILKDKHKFNVHIADRDGWTALHFSASSGCYEFLTYLVDIGTNIYLQTSDGRNCLHIAASKGHLNLCKTLIKRHSFDVLAADNNGWTALHFSARNGSYQLVTYFVGMGMDIDLKNNDGWNCGRIASIYGHLNLCSKFIGKHNFNVHLANNDGWTALHFSAKNGSYELITFFTNMGADINLKTNDGKNCLHIAALYGHLNLCKILIYKHKFDVCMADNDGWAAHHFSSRNGSYELLTYIADIGANIYLETNDGKNCLHIAAWYGHLNLCKALIDKHKFDVYMVDSDGWAALHFSARNGNYNLHTYFANIKVDINFKANNETNCLHIAALYGHLKLCTTLIQRYRFDIHMADNDGWTALHFSARNGSYELVNFFVDMGAAINLQTNDGKNCLHIAALYGHLNLSKALINEHEFDVHMTDNDGWRPIHFSARNGSYELLTYFVNMGANVNIKTNYGKNCLHIAALFGHFNLCKKFVDEHNFDVRLADNEGWTALHFSVRHGCDKLVTYFAKMGIDIGLESNDGWNSCRIAAIYGHLHLCKTLINKHNFDVHMTDNDGWTALHFSAKTGSLELFKIFVDMKSDIDLK